MQTNLYCCRSVWRQVRSALLCSSLQKQKQVNHLRVPMPSYQPGQKVWLSSKNLPIQTESRKLTPRFVGPFEVHRMVNAAAVRLKLLSSIKIHLGSMSHGPSELAIPYWVQQPMLLPQSGSSTGHPPTWSNASWMSAGRVKAGSSWWFGRDTVQRRDHGFPSGIYWTRNSSVPSTGITLTSLVECQEVW